MEDIRLRILALERGENVPPPTDEEIRQALRARIGNRLRSLEIQHKNPARTPKPKALPKGGVGKKL
jgi:hypothetical protein